MNRRMLAPRSSGGRSQLVASGQELSDVVADLLGQGTRLALVAAHDDSDVGMRVVYVFLSGSPQRRIEVVVPLDRDKPVVASLAGLSFPAGRFEREMHDLYGIVPLGHPLARRLVRHPHWPAGWYPMRQDAGQVPPFGAAEEVFPFLTVGGAGVYEIPVGPIHAGLIEPGHFRFSVVGETILKLKARLWYVHKGIERLFEGRPAMSAVDLAERISGDTAAGHALAYCQAVEDALDIEVSARALAARAMVVELERIYNHIADIGALCNDVGHGIINAHAQRIREALLRLNAEVTGHRLLRGAMVVGGARLVGVPDPDRLTSIAADIRDVVALALRNSLVAERFTGTAVLSAQSAHDLGTLGYVARASGLSVDARRDHPSGPAGGDGEASRTLVGVPTQSAGDVLARFQQRAAEIEESFVLLHALLDAIGSDLGGLAAGRVDAGRAENIGAASSGLGIVEGWRGTIVHRVEIDRGGRLTRVKIVDPSFFNWPALPVALAGTIVPDFPLVNKSFNLSYAGNDL